MNSSENGIFILSLISKCFEKNGTEIIISKEDDKDLIKMQLASIQLLFPLLQEKKYEIHFDFGASENLEILSFPEKSQSFIKIWKKVIAKNLDIEPENFIFTDLHFGTIAAHAASIEKIDDSSIKSLQKGNSFIKEIKIKPIVESIQISKSLLEPKKDRNKKWGVNEKRGGEKYIPPIGWNGIGLKVTDMYDNGDNKWLSFKNIEGAFAVAYLGINNFLNDTEIMMEELNNACDNIKNLITNKLFADEIDLRNKHSKCGNGICVFQNPEIAENAAGIFDINGYRIKIILMCRVNPKKIRLPKNFPECWILNPNSEEIRPYRILIKKIPISPLTGQLEDKIIICPSPVAYIVSSIKEEDYSFLKEKKNYKKSSKINGEEASDDFFVIRLYSTHNFKYLNNYLRKREISKYFSEEELKSWVCCLYRALSRNKNVKNGTIVYRGIRNKFNNEFGVGSKFFFREFLSTSTKFEFAKNWIKKTGGTLMIIEIKNNGTEGYQNYCYYIEDITFTKNQDEILLSTHCYFTVTKIEKKDNLDLIYLICEGILLGASAPLSDDP